MATGYVDTALPGVATEQLTTATSVITVLSIPYLAYALVQAINPSFLDLPARRMQVGAVMVAVIVGVGGFLLGRTNDHFLTCGDFVVSGNDQPANCRPGEPTTVLFPDR